MNDTDCKLEFLFYLPDPRPGPPFPFDNELPFKNAEPNLLKC